MNEIKVAFDNQIFQRQKYGGISRYFIELQLALSGLPIESKILAPLHLNKLLKPRYSLVDFSLRVNFYTNRFGIGQKIDQISSKITEYQLKSFQPTVIHQTFFSNKPPQYGNVPRVITVFDLIRERENPKSFKTLERLKTIQNADHVICISNSTRNDLEEFIQIPEKAISTIHLAASPEFIAKESNDMHPEGERPYILYVGQRDGYKNFRNLLVAFSLSPELVSEFRLVAFGGGQFTTAELLLISKLGLQGKVLNRRGSDSSLHIYYKHARAFIFPSLYEGFGIPILEAMSSGCPVICSNTSSFPEIAGGAAVFFSPDNCESIASTLKQTLLDSSLLQRLRNLGFANVENFSWHRTATQTADAYFKL